MKPGGMDADMGGEHHALLATLQHGLAEYGIFARLAETPPYAAGPEPGDALPRVPPWLEIVGRDGEARAAVTVVRAAQRFSYRVNPRMGDAYRMLFPVDEIAEAVAYIIAEARKWEDDHSRAGERACRGG
ncbi:hypothetical protein [Sphaerisporangium dianthi]|uniref:Uncharacterized protein n=1 Tax=Sphaerisporangium dianthi TaxID=1436120 RepID=A0ABV9CDN2_9ACTN